MATVQKRKKNYVVIYRMRDNDGKIRQKWEAYPTRKEAMARKKAVEYQQQMGIFISPANITLEELIHEYVEVYGKNKWAISTYYGNIRLFENYIIPIIGQERVQNINRRFMDQFYQRLTHTKAKYTPFGKKDSQCKYVSSSTIREIHKLLHSVFVQAVAWELVSKNPTDHCILPKCTESRRDIWDVETIFYALERCKDPVLELAINLAFSCSLRMGELLGLTWDCVDVSDESVRQNKAYIYVNKEIQRISKRAIDDIKDPEVYYRFPGVMAGNQTDIILKAPKTKTSIRKVFLPKAVAEMLQERKKVQREYMEILGEEYQNYDLVMCQADGRPMDGGVINKAFHKLIEENDLPPVVFHSLRHSSTTYKLKLSGGDIKAVQGDTGHAQATMVTERYAHILDDDRRVNAERFQREFYEQKLNADQKAEEAKRQEAERIMTTLMESPELMQLLSTLIKKS